MSNERIEDLTAQLSTTLSEMDWMGRTQRPRLRSAASSSELEKMEAQLGRPVPASYKSFLRMANGMEGADQFDWMIAGCSPPKKGEKFENIKAQVLMMLKGIDPKHPLVIKLERAVIVGTDFDSLAIFFDEDTFKQDEPALLKISLDDPTEVLKGFTNYEAFLEYLVQIYEDTSAFLQQPVDDLIPNIDLGDLAIPTREKQEDDNSLLAELDSLLGGFGFDEEEEEEEEEMQISPEMQLASDMCNHVIDQLVAANLIELATGAQNKENLEDYLLKKLLRVTREDQIFDSWIAALAKSQEVEELYGTDDELKKVMNRAWNEIAEKHG